VERKIIKYKNIFDTDIYVFVWKVIGVLLKLAQVHAANSCKMQNKNVATSKQQLFDSLY